MNWYIVKIVLLIIAVLLIIRFARTFWMILQSYHLWAVPTCSRSAGPVFAEEYKIPRRNNICNNIADLIADRHPIFIAEFAIIGLAYISYKLVV